MKELEAHNAALARRTEVDDATTTTDQDEEWETKKKVRERVDLKCEKKIAPSLIFALRAQYSKGGRILAATRPILLRWRSRNIEESDFEAVCPPNCCLSKDVCLKFT